MRYVSRLANGENWHEIKGQGRRTGQASDTKDFFTNSETPRGYT